MSLRLLYFWLAIFATGTLRSQEKCQLTLRLNDGWAGCVRLSEDGGKSWETLPPLLPRMLGLSTEKLALGWHVLTGETVITVPRAEVVIEAFSGIETDRARVEIDLRERAEHRAQIPLRRLFHPIEQGWIAGNTHLHLQKLSRGESDRYLVEISRADGLEVVFVSYLERALVDRAYITNSYSAADLALLSRPGLVFGTGEEYRHNFGPGGEAYGHVLMLDLASRVLPASLGPGITQSGDDATPLRPGLQRAGESGAAIVWCHNAFGFEDLPNWLDGIVHAQNIFDGGNKGGYEDTFYRYLNLGMRVPFSTGTDWFIYDFSRVYVKKPEAGAEVTPENWLRWLRSGETAITNGAWIEFSVNGRGPGSVIDLKQPGRVALAARVIGRHDFGALEIVRNGTVVHTATAKAEEGCYGAAIDLGDFSIGEACWLAARIRPATAAVNEFGERLFAHTSAVHIRVDGEEVFVPETAAAVRAELEESRRAIREKGVFPDDAARDAVLELYRNREIVPTKKR